jgi:hypothetical protein
MPMRLFPCNTKKGCWLGSDGERRRWWWLLLFVMLFLLLLLIMLGLAAAGWAPVVGEIGGEFLLENTVGI